MGKKGKYNQKNDEDEGKKKNFIITQQHLMDKTHMQTTEYLPFLPVDSLYAPYDVPESQVQILREILKQLNYSLYMPFKNFWATILYNPTFKICIHTCIRFFHRRWLNQYQSKALAGNSQQSEKQLLGKIKFTEYFQYTQQLMKIVLLIYFRIVHFEQENSELSNLHHIKNEIINKYILDIPKLLEIIEVYGDTNEPIVKVIVKKYTNLDPQFYSVFTSQIMEPMMNRMNKNLNMIKKTTDRQQFGIQYNYKRTVQGQLSPGQEQLSKKVKLLMEIISFYETLKNVYGFFPTAWAEYTKFCLQIHNISESLFIQVEQAYKVWNNHDQGQKLYSLMNAVLKYIVDYFVEFLQKCQAMFIQKNEKSNYKQAYIKCLDRLLENYGRRQSLGKKFAATKRYMHMYRQILKVFQLDEFTSKLIIEETENGTYGFNMEFLIDFKIAIDEQIAKMNGKQINKTIQSQLQAQRQEEKTQAGHESDRQQKQLQAASKEQAKQKEKIQKAISDADRQKSDLAELDHLQLLISKRNRQEDYYEKMLKDYRTKMVIQYDDQYDDLKDYEKRPMFEDNDKQEQDSSDGSSGDEFDSEMQQLHLVKSNSNVSRARGPGTQHHHHQKYQRHNKVKYVPVKQAQAKAIINREANRANNGTQRQKEKTKYEQKQRKQTEKQQGNNKKGRQEYNDEQCYQECRQKNKQQKKQRQQIRQKQLKGQRQRRQDYDDRDDNSDQNDMKRQNDGNYGGGSRGAHGGRGGRGGYQNNYNKPKGTNTNKKPKYVAKQ